jgi:predicted amidophosphoribosyltransferase
MMPKTSFAIQVIRSRYEGMISMFCSQCGAPMGDNDKFCGVCGAPMPALQPPPLRVSLSSLFRNRPWRMRQRAVWLRRSKI